MIRPQTKRVWWHSTLATFLFLILGHQSQAQDRVFSVVIEGGTVVDGLGQAGYAADVGIIGDRIVAIGDLRDVRAGRRVDASGLIVSPGFIDIHSHATSGSIESSGVVRRPLAENYVRQGVTTALGGQDGGSPIDIGQFLAYLDHTPSAINVGLFIGHGSVRGRVMNQENRIPSESELAKMTGLVERAMLDGAFGLSSGLEYTPGSYAAIDELVAIAKPLAAHDGLYISHIRDEGSRVLDSVNEVILVGERSGVAAQVTHHKVIGKGRWGRTKESLELIDRARGRGVDVSSDVYPYTASSTGMTILFPAWAKDGGNSALLSRLEDPGTRQRIHQDVANHIVEERGADPSTIVAARCPGNESMDGMSLADILVSEGKPVTVAGAADVAMRLVEEGGCSGVFHSMSEEDVQRVMRHEQTMISSDGGVPAFGEGVPHPRNYGAFARVLRYYVRELETLSLEEAISKMSRVPADRLGLKDRGRIEVGAVADIVAFDFHSIADQARFGDPHHYAAGVHHVFVSGKPVLLDMTITGLRPGKALRRP